MSVFEKLSGERIKVHLYGAKDAATQSVILGKMVAQPQVIHGHMKRVIFGWN